jgi:hypothetical protein
MKQMPSHAYTIAGHKRTDIAKWFGMAAVVLSALLSSMFGSFATEIHAHFPRLGVPLTAAISASAIYMIIHWLFDKWGWRICGRFFRLPNLAGEWSVVGKTLDAEGNVRFEWESTLTISQTWSGIEIYQRAKQSESWSYTALVTPSEHGSTTLAYGYANQPNVSATELQRHSGFCELRFDSNNTTGEGSYFTSRERRSFGSMSLKRKT